MFLREQFESDIPEKKILARRQYCIFSFWYSYSDTISNMLEVETVLQDLLGLIFHINIFPTANIPI